MDGKRVNKLPWLISLICWLALGGVAQAWFWQDDALLTINGQQFSAEEYRHWWSHWREKGMASPTTPESFIDWQLMVQEGRRMELDQLPALQQKVQTFIKVRSLMQLKAEEVDGRVKIDQQQQRQRYQFDYLPFLNCRIYFFHQPDQAAKQRQALDDGSLSLAALAELPALQGGPSLVEERVLRLPQLNSQWQQALDQAGAGELHGPLAMDKGAFLVEVLQRGGGDDDDFALVVKGIKAKLQEEQEARLTTELVARLRQKFAVEVEEEVLAVIGDDGAGSPPGDKPLLRSSKGVISAADFQAMLSRERAFRQRYKFKDEEAMALKSRVLDSMVAQTLISWEALERHYEQRSPLKEMVAFYQDHRLVREVESRFIKPASSVSSDEVKRYYLDNVRRYSHPETVGVAMVEGEEELITMIVEEIRQGRDFFSVVERHFPTGVPTRQLPLNHFSSQVQKILGGLQQGEVSSKFKVGEQYSLLKLVNRRQQTAMPLQQVGAEIERQLIEERTRKAREDFLTRLREQSTIVVDDKRWQQLAAQLNSEPM